MSTALYQLYRPQQFGDLVGQDHIRNVILSEIAKGDTAHAYVFSGPRGVGKTSVARLVSRALNCTSRTEAGEPCGTCSACVMIRDNKALDVMEIDAASHTGVDHVREQIIEYARTAPSALKYKVFIIDEVHMLSTSAFNALLKTLEEPPAHAVFILATTEIHKVPATIISRCEHFRFRRLDTEVIVAQLKMMCAKEKREVDDVVLAQIARRADGGMRDAQSILGQVLSLGADRITAAMAADMLGLQEVAMAQEIALSLTQNDVARALMLTRDGITAGAQASEIIRSVVELLRAALLTIACKEQQYMNSVMGDVAAAQKMSEAFAAISSGRIATWIEVWIRATEQQKSVPLPQLAIELAIVKCIAPEEVVIAAPIQAAAVKQASRAATQVKPKSEAPELANHFAQFQTSPAPKKVDEKEAVIPAKNEATAPAQPELKKVVEIPAVEKFVTKEVPTAPMAPEAAPEPVVKKPVADLTVSDIKALWTKVLEAMKKRNNGLHLTLQVGKFVDFKDRAIMLGFQYQFYRDRLRDARNVPVIDEALAEVFGPGLHIEAVIGNEYVIEHVASSSDNVSTVDSKEIENVWDLAVQAFQPKRIDEQAN